MTPQAAPLPCADILEILASSGVTVRLKGDRLAVTLPSASARPAVDALVLPNRDTLVAYLKSFQAPETPSACEAEPPRPAPVPTASEWAAALDRLRAEADADGVVRDEPGDLFCRLADVGRA